MTYKTQIMLPLILVTTVLSGAQSITSGHAARHRKASQPFSDIFAYPVLPTGQSIYSTSSQIPPGATAVHTDMERISTIELPEKIISYIPGSEQIEIVPNDEHTTLMIRPLTEGLETNLIVNTEHMRAVYEIMPAGDPRGESYIKTPLPGTSSTSSNDFQKMTEAVSSVIENVHHIDSRAIRMDSGTVNILIRQITEDSANYYVQIALRNGSSRYYEVMNPAVAVLRPTKDNGQVHSNLGKMIADDTLHNIGFYTETPLAVRSSTLQPATLAPRQIVQWVLAFAKSTKTPGVYRFTFPSDNGRPVYAVAVF